MESKRPVRNKNIFCLSASKDEQLTGETIKKERNNDYGLFTHENINAKYFYIDKKLVQDDKTTNTKESNVETKESNVETKKATTNRKYNPKKSLLKMKYN
mgnify:CR=1 FL=1